MVRRVRIMLRLQRQTITKAIDCPAFAGDGPIEEVTGVKLQARLSGGDVHRATACRLDDARREYQRVRRRAAAIEYPIVIVAVAVPNLGIRSLIYSRSDRCWRPEVERLTLHRFDLAGRNQ